MTPAPAAGEGDESSAVDPEVLVSEAVARLEAITSLGARDEAQTDLLGKRSRLARAHQGLVTLEPDRRPEAGKLLNEARRRIEPLLAERRRQLEHSERAARLQGDRMDPT